MLARQLDLSDDNNYNYFTDYSNIAGADSVDDSKQIRVYLPMSLKLTDGGLPFVSTKVKSSAKVIEVIGFICYLYTKQNRQPPLHTNVESYSLFLGKAFHSISFLQ